MGIVQIPSKQILPSKPRFADYYNGGAAVTTYYTIADITGKGKMLYARGYNYSGTAVTIRITVDGIQSTVTHPSEALSVIGYVPGSGTGLAFGFDFFTDLYFVSSLKVEIQRNANATGDLFGRIHYALE